MFLLFLPFTSCEIVFLLKIIMADDPLAILIGIVQNQHDLQQRMVEQNRQRNHELPTYSGKTEEDVLEFIETVNREALAGDWPENQKLQLAKGALREIASEWRWLHDAEAPPNWEGWSAALCAAFRKRYTFGEWEKMVTAKVQQTNETGPQYALTKAKLRRHCPYPMTEADFVPYLVQGIRHRQFRTVLLQNPPLTTTAFIQVYGLLEQNSDRAPERESELEARIEAQTLELAELRKQMGKNQRFQPYEQMGKSQRFQPYQTRTGRQTDTTSKERLCFECNRPGHLKRDCPEGKRSENDKAGPVGQARQ